MALLVAHQKQYVLGPSAVRIRPDWVATPIDDGLILSHCPRLAVHQLRARDDRHFWLLGLAVPADEIVDSLAAAFSARDSSEIETWALEESERRRAGAEASKDRRTDTKDTST